MVAVCEEYDSKGDSGEGQVMIHGGKRPTTEKSRSLTTFGMTTGGRGAEHRDTERAEGEEIGQRDWWWDGRWGEHGGL